MNDLTLHFNKSGTLVGFRGGQENNLLIPSSDWIGRDIRDIMPADMVQLVISCVEDALQTGELQSFEYLDRMSDSQFELRFFAGRDDKVSVIITNVSDSKQAAEKIKYLAQHDPLTDLPNRYLFNDRLNQAMAHAGREGQMLALLFLDIDNFKHINDTIGHKAGDKLLKSIADRLTLTMRRTDSISHSPTENSENLLARLGGDEFTILLTDVRNIQDPAMAAQRILNIMTEPFVIGDHEVFVTASLGIAVYPADGGDIDTLLINADIAMYQAKNHGRNNYQYYSESMNIFTVERFSIENKLRKAMDNNEFMLFYQPQLDIANGKMIGVEALIRWLQPDLVLIKPDQFISLAEQTGLIIPIGNWVLETACAANRAWQKAGLEPLNMTVNVSSIQFGQNNFVENVSRTLSDTGLKPQYLQLELTEGAIMQDSQSSIKKLQALKTMGIQIAIDDFGTGYSSLNYLKRFPLSTLKIDYSFVKDLIASPNDQAIVRAIISLAHNFNLKIIAEGVENKKQLTFLRECGCEGVQGNLICPPVNSEVLEEFLKKKKYLDVLNSLGIRK
jgi:diguanylate cyclase (GGDEF)-like protein